MKKLIFTFITITVLAFAQTTTYQLVINGQADTAQALVIDGQTYIPLDALQRAGIEASYEGNTLSLIVGNAITAGGANQRESLEGCMGQDFFKARRLASRINEIATGCPSVFHLHVQDLIAKAVMVFDKTGKQIAPIAVPESWTAEVSFGGKDHQTLFITASTGLYSIRMKHAGANAAE